MRIDELDGAILAATQLDMAAQNAKVAKRCKVGEHVVRYRLSRMRDEGVIRAGTILNIHALGLQMFELLFSLNLESRQLREKVLTRLDQSGSVYWMARLGGRFQYGVTVCAPSVSDASNVIEKIGAEFPQAFISKNISAIVSLSFFRKKYLAPKVSITAKDGITIGRTKEVVSIDEIDKKILSILYAKGEISHPMMARELKVPRSTIDARIKKLEDNKVLLAKVYLISARKLNFINYRIVLNTRSVNQKLSTDLYLFSLHHPNVVMFSHSMGSWNYTLGIEVESQSAVAEVVEEISDTFGSAISELEALPVLEQRISTKLF